ncbi:MAG: hypothetical protein ACYTEQ_23235 [Planctomycetota bacterium]|jgi:hypothetical protein
MSQEDNLDYITKMMDRLAKAERPPALDRQRYRSLLKASFDDSGGVTAATETLMKSTKHPALLKLRQRANECAGGERGRIPIMSSLPVTEEYPNVIRVLGLTVSGQLLLQALREQANIARCVLGAIALGTTQIVMGKFNRETMIEAPLVAFLDFREEFRSRIELKGSINALTQKQDRILRRIGHTVDVALATYERQSDPSHPSVAPLGVFRALWLAHLDELEGAVTTSELSIVSPNATTILMLECLFRHVSVAWATSKMGSHSREKLHEIYPLQRMMTTIRRKGKRLEPLN